MIRLIAAIDETRGIAKNGLQPWKLPEDEQYFQDQTRRFGGNILMGRTTFEVIGRALPGRTNYVASHQAVKVADIVPVTDLKQFIATFTGDLWVIGGAAVYEQTLILADELYTTEIETDFACDQFFPAFENNFIEDSTSDVHHENGLDFSYKIYKPC